MSDGLSFALVGGGAAAVVGLDWWLFFVLLATVRGGRAVHGRGLGRCRVAAACVSAGRMLAIFFITISQVIFVRTRSGFWARG